MFKISYKSILFTLCLMNTMIQVKAASNEDVDPHNYQYSMTITGEIVIDQSISTDINDSVFAYVNDECRGKAPLLHIASVDIYIVMLTVFSNSLSGENVVFKIKDDSEGTQVDCTNTISFEPEANYGTPSNPYQFTYSAANGINAPEGLNKNLFNCYPNPTSGIIYILSVYSVNNAHVELFSLDGKLLKEQLYNEIFGSELTFDISDLENNIYLIRIKTNSGYYTQKIRVLKN